MISKRIICGLACLMALAPALAAEPTRKETAGFEFTLPKKWKVVEDKESYAILAPEKEVVIVVVELKMLSAEELRKLKSKAEIIKFAEATGLLKEIEIDDEDAGVVDTQNGLTSTDFSGNAKYKSGDKKDKDTEFFVTILEGAKVPTLFFGTGDLEKYEKETDELFDSMRKIRIKKK